MIYRVGDPGKRVVEDNLRSLSQELERELTDNPRLFVPVLVSCATRFPERTTIYTSLIGLLNASNYDNCETIVFNLHNTLKVSLEECNFTKAQIVLRFISDLVNANVLVPDSIVAIFDTFLGVLAEDEVPQARVDSYIGLILRTLPWIGQELSVRNASSLQRMLILIEAYIKNRKQTHVKCLQSFHCEEPQQLDSLTSLWAQIKLLGEKGWKERAINRPYANLDKELVQCVQHTLLALKLPPYRFTDIYPCPEVTFLLFESQDVPENNLPSQHSIERFILLHTILEMLRTYTDNHKECAKHLIDFMKTVKRYPIDYLIVEAIFGELLRLPKPKCKLLFYLALLSEVIRINDEIGATIAQGIDILFSRIPYADIESQSELIEWIAYHLNFHEFKFNWQPWIQRISSEDESCISSVFVREVLSRAMRLTFYDRLLRSIPPPFTHLLPSNPIPSYCYENAHQEVNTHLRLSSLINLLRVRGSRGSDVSALLNQITLLDGINAGIITARDDISEEIQLQQLKLRILIPVALHVGVKSFSHSIFIIEKFGDAFQLLCSENQSKLLLIQLLTDFWKYSEQMTVILLDYLFLYRVVDGMPILSWVFSVENRPKLTRHYLWEITFNVLTKVCERASQAAESHREIGGNEHKEQGNNASIRLKADIDRALAHKEEAARTAHDCFVFVFSQLFTMLNEHIKQAESAAENYNTIWFGTIHNRITQIGRKFHFELSRTNLISVVRSSEFQDLDPRILDAVVSFRDFHAIMSKAS